MPLDLLTERARREQDLKDFLGARSPEITAQTGQTRDRIMAGRKPVFDALSSVSGRLDPSLAPAVNASVSQQMPGLNRKMESTIARTGFDQKKIQQQMIYDNAVRMAKESGLSLRASEDFARNYVNKQKQLDFQASQSNQDRIHQQVLQNLKEQYANEGLNIDERNRSSGGENDALARVLFGTGTAFITANAYNRSMANRARVQPSQPNAYLEDSYGR